MADAPPSRQPSGPGGAGRGAGWSVRRFAELDSTNRWLLDEARSGAAAGLVAVADHQTAGRGRRGRAWSAPPGSGLLVSVLLRPDLAPDATHALTMAAGLALRDAVLAVADVRAELKWPNDLVVADRKLAGLLAEADVSAAGAVRAVVVGLGCNVSAAAIPAELVDAATSCETEAGRPVERAALLDALLDHLATRLDDLDAVVADYSRELGTLGRHVRVELADGTIEGVATGVDGTGRLLVTPADGTAIAVAVGDVVHLRPAG